MNNNMNNLDINELMKILSKMDKKDLENGLAKASKLFNSPDADKIINNIRNNNNS